MPTADDDNYRYVAEVIGEPHSVKEAVLITKRLLLISICILAAMPVWAQEVQEAQQEPKPGAVRLEHKFRANDIQRFKMVAKMKMDFNIPGMPTPPQGTQMGISFVTTMRAKTLGILPDGDAKMRFTYEAVDLDMNIPGLPMMDQKTKAKMKKDMFKQMPAVTAVVNKYGALKSMNVPGMSNMPGMNQMPGLDKLLGGQQGMGPWSLVFPTEAVAVGDVWTQDIPLLDAGKLTIDYTLDSLNTRVGSRVAAKVKQDYTGSFQIGDLMKAIAPAMGAASSQIPPIDGSVDANGWGVTYFDAAKGKVIRSDADINMAVNLTMPMPTAPMGGSPAAPGQNMTITMNMNMKINLVALK